MASFLILLSAVVLAFWAAVALDRKRWWPSDLRLPEASPAGAAAAARGLAVIVPARDEAEIIGRTLPALLAQGDSFRALVIADDRSSDGTARLAAELAAGSPCAGKVRVVRVPQPPAGWSGKVHALEAGVRELAAWTPSPEWILFTDADVVHAPGSLAALVEKSLAEGLDLVSVMVRLSVSNFWEKLLIPPFVYFFQLLYPFRRVAEVGSRTAAAAGGCLLLRREALDRMGGLSSVRGEVIDDVAIAKRVKASGGRIWLGTSDALVSARTYGSLEEIVRMVSRTAFVQLRKRYSLVALTLAGLALFLVSPPILAAAGAAG
ncbi:MAG: glycosyltransferase, partial [Planctomycetota bacterium]